MSGARRAADLAEWLTAALGELRPKQRFVLECSFGLRGDREYTFREIAACMGIDAAGVKRHYDNGMACLRGIAEKSQHEQLYVEGHIEPAAPVGDDVELGVEPICLSPFVPARYGLPPNTIPGGVREWLELRSDSE